MPKNKEKSSVHIKSCIQAASFSGLPRHLVFFMAEYLNPEEFVQLYVSVSFKRIVDGFISYAKTKQLIKSAVSKRYSLIAEEQRIKITDPDLETNNFTFLNHALDQKINNYVINAHNARIVVYRRGCCGGCGICDFCCSNSLSRRGINILRGIMIVCFSGSLYLLIKLVPILSEAIECRKTQDDDYAAACEVGLDGYMVGVLALVIAVTGGTLLVDAGRSLYSCYQERKIVKVKEQVSFLQTMSEFYNTNRETKELEGTPYVLLESGSP